MRQMVVGFMFSSNKELVALIHKTHPDWQAGSLNGVGGHRLHRESPQEAMAREFFEETGIKTGPEDWIYKIDLVNRKVEYELAILYAISDLVTDVKTMTDEKVVVIPIAYANKQYLQVVNGIEWMIPLCLDQSIKPVILMEDIGEN